MEPRQVFKSYEGPVNGSPVRFCAACGSPCADVVAADGRAYRTCTACGRVHFRNPSPTVSVVVVKDESLLLCLREPQMFRGGMWCLPGGYMEFDEDFLSAGRREVLEETGLDVQVKGILSVHTNFHTPDMSSLSIIMLAHPQAGVAEPRDETQEVRWIGFGEPLPEMAFEHHEYIIQRYIATRYEGAPVDPRFAGLPP